MRRGELVAMSGPRCAVAASGGVRFRRSVVTAPGGVADDVAEV